MDTEKKYYPPEQVQEILSRYSILDYFKHLENQGRVTFERKTGHDYYYHTADSKYSVSAIEDKYYDFIKGEGGGLAKAVMTIEDTDWKGAIQYLNNLSGYSIENARTVERDKTLTANIDKPLITVVKQPQSKALLDYFEKRGISNEVLKAEATEVHYRMQGKDYYGIGIQNISEGYELRNPTMKTKLGQNHISIKPGDNPNQMIVFEGMTDQLSFLQLLKDNGKDNHRTLVTLNSVTNTDKFIEHFKEYPGQIYLCLDGDTAGEAATRKIKDAFSKGQGRDIRPLYNITPTGNNDLNDYLKNKIAQQQIHQNNTKSESNGNNIQQSTAISTPVQNGTESVANTVVKPQPKGESQQNKPDGGRPALDGQNVGNGFTNTGRPDQRSDGRTSQPVRGSQQSNNQKNAERKNTLGGGLLTNVPAIDTLLAANRGKKVSNAYIKLIVDGAVHKNEEDELQITPDLTVTDELKAAIVQFRSGGTTKDGRGILDEYYTDHRIATAIGNILKQKLANHKTLAVLEPSIGTGNFLTALKTLPQSKQVTGFEINPTSAKIAKLFYPDAKINLRSFETEFITDNGTKKNNTDYSAKYDLVIGNPPYGQHRGFYKGLGEERNISRYEDYFVKRSLDSLKSDGVLAMVLPSGWLNRQNSLSGADLLEAYRLPSGAFKDTQIGTDIIILKKSDQKKANDIRHYFENHPERILGEIREKTNQFGRAELYVHGTLEDALSVLARMQTKQGVERIGYLFVDLEPEPVRTTAQLPSEKKGDSPESTDKKTSEQKEVLSQETIKKTLSEVAMVLDVIARAAHPSTTLQRTRHTFEDYKAKLIDTPEIFVKGDIEKISKSADSILKHLNRNTEYHEQGTSAFKKGILKYQFHKKDSLANTSLQNASGIPKEEQEAFLDTNYSGVFTHPEKFLEKANLYNGQWVHDFYYTEGNIYAKLEQLEKDFAGLLTSSNGEGINDGDRKTVGLEVDPQKQYEKQKKLLLSVLPKPKTLDQIIISPNHEFVHKFPMGTHEVRVWNEETRQNDMVTEPCTLAEKFKDFVYNLSPESFKGSNSFEVWGFVDNETVTGSDKDRNALIRERRKEAANDLFVKFLHSELDEDTQQRFVDEFNRNYNNVHIP